ncbi:TraR/DksA family transcriptional regulator [Paractinoplanes brasiliensis]|uniref:TraR/DksA family transcriptional regulator n=1 Tax=Paractinoplanes brasiliensis TaxID=52695 RepID=A0A4R6JQA8_9ACTN|nr:TraR/DksA C4-type zinc finger protein [Actinoplanes brasiliensis]TDO38684.1 TraR/DksA family transcriptional regulator [Actinoplanes brasiliensis]GID26538.1 DnaK suppressor protein [Actinoplanes brasiliensis]
MDHRAALLGLRSRAVAEIATLDADLHALFEASRSDNADDEHDPEGATIAYERAQLTSVLSAARAQLSAVEEALSRLDAGTYGVCESCGRPIPDERLEIRPFATTCVSCASRR